MLPVAVRAATGDLSQVQAVYLLPMGNGFDQYLANRLTQENVYQVVTDPKRADAVLTDQVGLSFERRLAELYPPPAAPKPEGKDEKAESKKEEPYKPLSTFQRGKGNIYLVDLKSRRILWSVYERPKRYQADDLDKTSVRIVEKLKKDLGR